MASFGISNFFNKAKPTQVQDTQKPQETQQPNKSDSAAPGKFTNISNKEIFSEALGAAENNSLPASSNLKDGITLIRKRELSDTESLKLAEADQQAGKMQALHKDVGALGEKLAESTQTLDDILKEAASAKRESNIESGQATKDLSAAHKLELAAKKVEMQLSDAATSLKQVAHNATQYLGDAGQGIKEKADSAAQGLQKAALTFKEKAHSAAEVLKEAALSAKQAVETATKFVMKMTAQIIIKSFSFTATALSKLSQVFSSGAEKIDTLSKGKLSEENQKKLDEAKTARQTERDARKVESDKADAAFKDLENSLRAGDALEKANTNLESAKKQQEAKAETLKAAEQKKNDAAKAFDAADKALKETKAQLEKATVQQRRAQSTLFQLQKDGNELRVDAKKMELAAQELTNEASRAQKRLDDNAESENTKVYQDTLADMTAKKNKAEDMQKRAEAKLTQLTPQIDKAQKELDDLNNILQGFEETLKNQKKNLDDVTMPQHKEQLAYGRIKREEVKAQAQVDKAQAQVDKAQVNKAQAAQQQSLVQNPSKEE